MAKIKLGWSGYPDADLAVKSVSIYTSFTANPYFPNPVPAIPVAEAATTAFQKALADMPGGRDVTILKNQKRADLEAILTNLGLYAQAESGGDEVKLSTLAFDIANKPQPVGVLPKPQNFVARPGDARQSIKLSLDAVFGARCYLYEYTATPITADNVWTPVLAPRASMVIENLESGKEYGFRVVAIGANPTRVYSDVVTSFVL